MLISDKLILGLVFLTPMPSMASVVVSSPASGSIVTNPVVFTANGSTATCSTGVASMGVYLDGSLLTVVNGSQLSSSLVISPGTHNAVVEEWDKCGGATYSSMSITVSASPSPVTPAPAFSLPAGAYTSAQSVALTDTAPGAKIYYTTNGTTATTSSILYVGPISVTASQSINAIAVVQGNAPSAVVTAPYTITLPTSAPVFSLPAGTYTSQQMIGMANSTPGAAIYYTTDGTTPSTSSLRYHGVILLGTNTTINAIALAPGHSTSTMTSAAYSISLATAPPRFTLPSGTYTSVQVAMLSDPTPGAIMYYTLDGSAPTTSSYQYVTPIPVANTKTIRAIATAPGYSSSPIVTAAYTVNLPTAAPTFSVPTGAYTTIQSVTLSDATPGAVIYYTLNGTRPSVASTLYTGPLQVSSPQIVMAMAIAPGYTSSGPSEAYYNVKVSAPTTGPEIPADAIGATALQVNPRWEFNHDPGTPGSSLGAKSNVSTPTISGSTGEFSSSYSGWGGEIFHLSFANDAASTNFVYDAEIWIAQGSQIDNLEMDMNQVISDGDTVLFAFQCNGNNGTWDYGANTGAIRTSKVGWVHSSAPCNPATWSTNTWHHVQIAYTRDEVGNVTYNSVWLDGVEASIGMTVPSAQTLGWPVGTLLTNLQVDGPATTAASVVYVDNLTITRW